jgi:hypothetical protein
MIRWTASTAAAISSDEYGLVMYASPSAAVSADCPSLPVAKRTPTLERARSPAAAAVPRSPCASRRSVDHRQIGGVAGAEG